MKIRGCRKIDQQLGRQVVESNQAEQQKEFLKMRC